MGEYLIEHRKEGALVAEIRGCRIFSTKPASPAKQSSLTLILQDLFLPKGYPNSVSPDYIAYQKWDTLQAFASSMTSALATEAILRGAGVGNKVESVYYSKN